MTEKGTRRVEEEMRRGMVEKIVGKSRAGLEEVSRGFYWAIGVFGDNEWGFPEAELKNRIRQEFGLDIVAKDELGPASDGWWGRRKRRQRLELGAALAVRASLALGGNYGRLNVAMGRMAGHVDDMSRNPVLEMVATLKNPTGAA